MRSFCVAALLVVVHHHGTAAFLLPGGSSRSTRTTELAGLLGRFRKKRTVDQVRTIQPGDSLPETDIEVLQQKQGDDGDDDNAGAGGVDCSAVAVGELLGEGKTLLVGMPGAFTPTCTGEHLPGYVRLAPTLATKAGIDNIAIVTTNDRYVNEEWSTQQGVLTSTDDNGGSDQQSSNLMILCDGDGDFVKSLGLADDMGFGVGVRSKRFVVVLDDGKVEQVVMDEGMDDCKATSAESVLKLLAPDEVVEEQEAGDGAQMGVLASVAAVVVFAATSMGGGGIPPSNAPPPPKKSATRVEKVVNSPASTSSSSKGSSSFSLLDEFKP